jgi:hypothetical protein
MGFNQMEKDVNIFSRMVSLKMNTYTACSKMNGRDKIRLAD